MTALDRDRRDAIDKLVPLLREAIPPWPPMSANGMILWLYDALEAAERWAGALSERYQMASQAEDELRDLLRKSMTGDIASYDDLKADRDKWRARAEKAEAKVAAVEALAEALQARSDHQRQFATTIPEDLQDGILEGAADFQFRAQGIRAALASTEGPEQ